ncbi:MAG: NAD(P)H-hydrate dehydratase [Clostridiales bacterium]|jgi:NAD(P)H-hydrate epimerase|nr:NAD(P)H-hydrate dehydratase [Clostridiales bacterium]
MVAHRVVSVAEIKAAEQSAMTALGLTEAALIDRAAAALFDCLAARIEPQEHTVFYVGGGNNGCDGLATARLLHMAGYRVSVKSVGDTFSQENLRRQRAAAEAGVPLFNAAKVGAGAVCPDVVIDCLFGFGLNRPAAGAYLAAIREINRQGTRVYSVDVPSGLSADEGELGRDAAVDAGETLTFSAVKQGLLLYGGRNHTGPVTVLDIGVDCAGAGGVLLTEADVPLTKRPIDSHKGDYGRVKVIGGSPDMPGAPFMAAEAGMAALRSGAGRVTLCVPESLMPAYQARVTETMLRGLPDRAGLLCFDGGALDGVMESADAIAVGMGLGQNPALPEILRHLLRRFAGTLVLDADALNALAGDVSVLSGHRGAVILTPHIGEFRRLTGIEKPLPADAAAFAGRYGVTVTLKSATTVITDGARIYYNTTGSPVLAKGGSGDLLAGMTAAFACTMPALTAAAAGSYYLGKTAERVAAKTNSERSPVASDILLEAKRL